MAKTDWDWHRENLRKLREENDLTHKEYAEQYNLNPNTARRELGKKVVADRPKQATAKPDQTDDMIIRVKGRKAPHSKALGEIVTGEAPASHASAQKNKNKSPKSTRAKTGASDTEPKAKGKPRGKGKQFEVGNEVNLVPNRRGYPREVDHEAARELISEGLEKCSADTFYSTVAHMQLLKRTTERAVSVFEDEITALKAGGKKDDEQPGGPHPVLKLTKLLIEVGYLMNDHVSRVAAIAAGTDKNRRENEKHARKETEGQVVAQAFMLREENDWDIFQTAEYIERHGVKLPDSIALRLEKEIKDEEPEVEDTGTVDDDQLEEEARRYRATQANREVFLADRRATVARIVDERGYGDKNMDGLRREGELELDNEGIEFDYEATSDLYDPPEIPIDPPEEE